MPLAAIILAAGKGSRMNSQLTKVLHQIGGAPILLFPIKLAEALEVTDIITIISKGAEDVRSVVKNYTKKVKCIEQANQKGTGHAVSCAEESLKQFGGDVLVLYGDTPLITPKIIKAMLQVKVKKSQIVVLGFETTEPNSYGRMLLNKDGTIKKIVETKDANSKELKTKLCNSGIMLADKDLLFSLIKELSNKNLAGEYYLTDIIEIGAQKGASAIVIKCEKEFALGINTQSELATAEAHLQKHLRLKAMNNGATLIAPETVYFSCDTYICPETIINPYVVFGENVKIIGPAVINSFSHLEGCTVAAGASIGPFARVRPDSKIAEDVKIGNFVEVKNSELSKGVKAGHLAYIGDAQIGGNVNIGAGTIFCNYDGVSKHKITIDRNTFVGSNSSLIAPLKIGEESLIGAGSVITTDVPKHSMAISRVSQKNKKGLGKRIMDRLRKLKNKFQ